MIRHRTADTLSTRNPGSIPAGRRKLHLDMDVPSDRRGRYRQWTQPGDVREARVKHHELLIIGGGNAGISLAARLLRDGAQDVAVVEPEPVHRYRPLLNYVGAGEATMSLLERPAAKVVPNGCTWIRDQVVTVDAAGPSVLTRAGRRIGCSALVVSPGLEEDWESTPGWRRPTQPAGPGRPSSSTALRGCGPRSGTCPQAACSSPCRPSPLPAERPHSSRSSWRAIMAAHRGAAEPRHPPGPPRTNTPRRARGRQAAGAHADVVRRAGAARGPGRWC